MKKVITTTKAPAAIGPYNQAIEANGMVFISGQIPLETGTMEIVGNNVTAQTHQVLTNMLAILEEAGLGFENVVKTTCYLKSMNDFQEMNNVYAKYFIQNQPARAAVEVARLPKDVLVEIEAIAVK